MVDDLKIVTLNCQKGYQTSLWKFLQFIIETKEYDFILLQEASEKVILFIKSLSSEYQILCLYNHLSDTPGQLSIIFRNTFKVIDSKLFTFEKLLAQKRRNRSEFGLLIGKFIMNNSIMIIGSVHLSSGFNYRRRMQEVNFCKKNLIEYNNEFEIVWGGDFNSGLPWENSQYNKFLLPEFVNCTIDAKPTFNTAYVEPVNLLNRFSILISKIGIYFKLKIDHVFIGCGPKVVYETRNKVIKNKVSDHNPIEVVISKKIEHPLW